MRLTRAIPPSVKLKLRLAIRNFRDRQNGLSKNFAKVNGEIKLDKQVVETVQEIKQSSHFDNKVHNLRLGSDQISKYVIYPGQVFSFWKAVGKPTVKNGFKKGRNLIKGKLSEDVGGGLCQLSGIMYHTSLKIGLEILERHSHSLDIYKEEERYTPLGADATVVFGYKDLRIRNSFDSPICFEFQFQNNTLICSICTDTGLPIHEIDFIRENRNGQVLVKTFDRTSGDQICESVYKPISDQ